MVELQNIGERASVQCKSCSHQRSRFLSVSPNHEDPVRCDLSITRGRDGFTLGKLLLGRKVTHGSEANSLKSFRASESL